LARGKKKFSRRAAKIAKKKRIMTENEIGKIVVDTVITIH